jgi:hypothetical protein
MQEVSDSTGICPNDFMDFLRQIFKAVAMPLYTLSNVLFTNHSFTAIQSA